MMSSYLNQEAWTMYENVELEENNNEKNYGEDLV
jgi:hypothetical protein